MPRVLVLDFIGKVNSNYKLKVFSETQADLHHRCHLSKEEHIRHHTGVTAWGSGVNHLHVFYPPHVLDQNFRKCCGVFYGSICSWIWSRFYTTDAMQHHHSELLTGSR